MGGHQVIEDVDFIPFFQSDPFRNFVLNQDSFRVRLHTVLTVRAVQDHEIVEDMVISDDQCHRFFMIAEAVVSLLFGDTYAGNVFIFVQSFFRFFNVPVIRQRNFQIITGHILPGFFRACEQSPIQRERQAVHQRTTGDNHNRSDHTCQVTGHISQDQAGIK